MKVQPNQNGNRKAYAKNYIFCHFSCDNYNYLYLMVIEVKDAGRIFFPFSYNPLQQLSFFSQIFLQQLLKWKKQCFLCHSIRRKNLENVSHRLNAFFLLCGTKEHKLILDQSSKDRFLWVTCDVKSLRTFFLEQPSFRSVPRHSLLHLCTYIGFCI